jgi:hypothetical protein
MYEAMMIHSSGRERARTEAAPSSALVVVVLGGISASREGGCVCGGAALCGRTHLLITSNN